MIGVLSVRERERGENVCARVRVRACACVRARVCVSVREYVCMRVWEMEMEELGRESSRSRERERG